MKNCHALKLNLKELEQNLSNDEAKEQYNTYRGEISNGIKIRSKCHWYEFDYKSNEFFLTIEKRRTTQSIVHQVLPNEQEITDLSKIKTHI